MPQGTKWRPRSDSSRPNERALPGGLKGLGKGHGNGLQLNMLKLEECAGVAKPEWWNDEELKALSARVVRAAPDEVQANQMRALVLCGQLAAWEAGPRSAAELKKAATHFDRAAALPMLRR